MGEKRERNGAIDLFRALFCVIILSFHFSKDIYGGNINFGFFRNGGVCVELFFMISGYFMCKSAYRFCSNRKDNLLSQAAKISNNNEYTKESIRFISNKIKPFLFYHIILNTCMLLYVGIKDNYTFEKVLTLIPSFLFLPVTGFSDYEWIMGSEWYIGHMLFAMAIIYPFLIKWPDQISKYIAPIIGAILYGYLMKQYHTIIGSNDSIRAFAGIMLGVTAYHGSELIKKYLPEKRLSIISILSFIVFLGFIAYVGSHIKDRTIQPVWVILMWFVIMITFAERGLLSSTNCLNNPLIYYLGALSLPVYMVQNITRRLVTDIIYTNSAKINFLLEFGVTILCGIVLFYIHETIKKLIKGNMDRNIKRTVFFLICFVLVGASALMGKTAVHMYERADRGLLEVNAFKIYYHEADNMFGGNQTTLVTYGESTPIMTVDELGFSQEGQTFIGWKVYCPNTREWRLKSVDGEEYWKKWMRTGDSFALYKDGSSVKQTVKAGYTVHFYAQWETQ